MSIDRGLAGLGLLFKGFSSASGVIVYWWQILLLVKIGVSTLVVSTLIMGGIIGVSRTQTLQAIKIPPPEYLPGNPLPSLSDNIACNNDDANQLNNLSCWVHLPSQDVYFYYEARSKSIIRTILHANEYTIGALILAWGTPTGFDRYGTATVISWGTRSANLDAESFQPTNPVTVITYDLKPLKRSSWQGFGHH